jgi:hypothetical protein
VQGQILAQKGRGPGGPVTDFGNIPPASGSSGPPYGQTCDPAHGLQLGPNNLCECLPGETDILGGHWMTQQDVARSVLAASGQRSDAAQVAMMSVAHSEGAETCTSKQCPCLCTCTFAFKLLTCYRCKALWSGSTQRQLRVCCCCCCCCCRVWSQRGSPQLLSVP